MTVIAGSDRVYLMGAASYCDHIVMHQRVDGLDQLILRTYAGEESRIPFAEASYSAGFAGNPEFAPDAYRIGYSSMVTPGTVYDYHPQTGELEVLKVQEIPSGYDASQYATERLMVPARDYGHDLDAMLAAIADDTRLVFIANPNNPTGTHQPGDRVLAFLESVRERHGDRVVVLLDEAYDEYLDPEARSDSVRWVREFPNLIVTRTFSKAYGLAGLRVGYALAQPALTDLLNRVRQPFNVNVLAQLAARIALADTDFLARTYALNRAGRAQLQEGFAALGLDFVPSYTNFVLVRVGNAARVNGELLRRGVIVRPVAGDGLPEHLRVSIGLPEENARLLDALKAVLQA